ncbi:MAG: IclR family transcriptional regulator, partial [Psychrobacter sp.]|nr:IclR family transcriptional regulator [Psychrobacter sp.]
MSGNEHIWVDAMQRPNSSQLTEQKMSLSNPKLATADSQSPNLHSQNPKSQIIPATFPPPTQVTKDSRGQNGVQSLEIGLSVLDVLIDRCQPMMLKDIAGAMQMPPAKAHRYLVSLIRKGYARQLSDGRYGLGARVDYLGTLGHSGLNQHNILQRLATASAAIRDALNCAVQIAKWVDGVPIIIHSIEPDSPISIITRIGSKMPLTTSATGLLFASYQPVALIEPLVIAEWQDQKQSQGQIKAHWQQFLQQRTQIRDQGFAMVSGDMVIGIHAIAIPVRPLVSLDPSPLKDNQLSDGEEPSHNNSSSIINDPKRKNHPSETQMPNLEYVITVIGTSEQLPLAEQQSIA